MWDFWVLGLSSPKRPHDDNPPPNEVHVCIIKMSKSAAMSGDTISVLNQQRPQKQFFVHTDHGYAAKSMLNSRIGFMTHKKVGRPGPWFSNYYATEPNKIGVWMDGL